MPKEKKLTRADAVPDDEGQSGPEMQPKPGDRVNYIFAPNTGHDGKVVLATVRHVHEGHNGRLVNLEVDADRETLRIGPASFRPAEQNAGNTWHWPVNTK